MVCLGLICLLCACTPDGVSYTPPSGDNVTKWPLNLSSGDNLTIRQPRPPSPPPEPQLSPDEPVSLAQKHMAAQLGIAISDISVVSAEKVNWPDTSLGLPEPGKFYAAVIVPGFKITLKAGEQDYVYHAGLVGQRWLIIQQTSPKT